MQSIMSSRVACIGDRLPGDATPARLMHLPLSAFSCSRSAGDPSARRQSSAGWLDVAHPTDANRIPTTMDTRMQASTSNRGHGNAPQPNW
jgi:hypothetical protein